MTNHLKYSWYRYELPETLLEWILDCITEYIDIKETQPYDTVYIRAKNHINGKKEYKLVFQGKWVTAEKTFSFPLCYLMDLNIGKFKGNKMNYQVGSGHLYSEMYPVYNEHFKFGNKSKFNQEKGELIMFLKGLDIPEAKLTGHEKRKIEKQRKRQYRRSVREHKNNNKIGLNRGRKRQRLIDGWALKAK